MSRLMRKEPQTAPHNASVHSLVHDYVMGNDDQSFPVEEYGRFVGLVTMQDIRQAPRGQWHETMTEQIMTPLSELSTVEVSDEAVTALHKLRQQGDVRQLPVMENSHLVGMVRRRDIMKWLQLQDEIP